MRIVSDLITLARKHLSRHPLRTGLTVAGVATGLLLFTVISSLQAGLERATTVQADSDRMIVFRANRFCPLTSRLPQHYDASIERVDGVAASVPMAIHVNTCGTSLDMVTFRGIDPADLELLPPFSLSAGSIEAWHQRSDAALVGRRLAQKRGLEPGDAIDAAGLTVQVAGIIDSDDPQMLASALVHLDFLQRSQDRLGTVSQFLVRVSNPERRESIAETIDARFASDPEPTATRPEQAFVAATAGSLVELIDFTRSLSLAAVLAVLLLVGNAMSLAVNSRIRENAVLRTIGFQTRHLAVLVLAEGLLLGLAGGLLGTGLGALILYLGSWSIGTEGLSIVVGLNPDILLTSLLLAIALGITASALPAYKALRQSLLVGLRG